MAQFNVTLEQIESALRGFAANTSGGFIDLNSREYLIRNLGRTNRMEDAKGLAVTYRNGMPVLMDHVETVRFAAAFKRGDEGLNGKPAVIVSVQKQQAANTVKLKRDI